MKLKYKFIVSFFLIIFLFISVSPAIAHKVTVFAWVNGDTAFVESKFAGGRKVKEGEVVVSDSEGNQLLKGKTNDEGEFSFKIPKKTALTVTIIAGMGHQGEWTIPAEEIGELAGKETKPDDLSLKVKSSEGNMVVGANNYLPLLSNEDEPQVNTTAPTKESSTPDIDEIQAAVEKALDKKLKPVMKILTESQERKPTFTDIFGGIGYILGLMGIAAYFNFRRKKDK